jgi:hypothetical protein
MRKKIRLNLITFSILFSGCAGGSFTKKIQNNELDILADESLMRYNTNRLDSMVSNEKDFISNALLACHQNKFIKGCHYQNRARRFKFCGWWKVS